MKKQLILGSLLSFAGMVSAQGPDWAGAANTTGNLYRSGNVGIGSGMTSPAHILDIISAGTNDGLQITMPSAGVGAASIYLTNLNTYGHQYVLGSNGTANSQGVGKFSLYDYTNAMRGGPGTRMIVDTLGNVGFNTNTPQARVHVIGDQRSANLAGRFDISANAQQIFTGISGNVLSVSGQVSDNTGVYGSATSNVNTLGYNRGLVGIANGGLTNYGVYGNGIGNNNSMGLNIGVYGTASGGTTGNNWAGYFAGNVIATAYSTSDRKLKSDIKPLNNALARIQLLKPSTYLYKTSEFKDLNLPAGNQMGLIAQELEEVFPELVKEVGKIEEKNAKGEVTSSLPSYKSVNYTGLVPVLIAGIQEQQQLIENQNKKIADLQEQLNSLLTNKTGAATGINQPASGAENFALDQNIPNPFSQETVIKYSLPQQVSNAALVVYDLSGKQVASFPITEKGASSMTITSEKLSAGIYIYSVMADGKILDSKRMVVAQK